MERLNKLVDWYKFKLDEIREAPVDSRPRKLEKLYRYSEANKDSGVTIREVSLFTGRGAFGNFSSFVNF